MANPKTISADYIRILVHQIRDPRMRNAFKSFAKLTERTLVHYIPEPDPADWPGGKDEYARELITDMIKEAHGVAMKL